VSASFMAGKSLANEKGQLLFQLHWGDDVTGCLWENTWARCGKTDHKS